MARIYFFVVFHIWSYSYVDEFIICKWNVTHIIEIKSKIVNATLFVFKCRFSFVFQEKEGRTVDLSAGITVTNLGADLCLDGSGFSLTGQSFNGHHGSQHW